MLINNARHFFENLGRGWLVVWVVAVPLIHSHPETAHSHGGHEHFHEAQYHSVISEDHSHQPHHHSHSHHSAPSRGTAHFFEHNHVYDPEKFSLEIGFSFLTNSVENLLVPPGSGNFLDEHTYPVDNIIFLFAEEDSPRGFFPNWLVISQPRIRPPPFLSL